MDWDKLAADVKKEEKEEKLDGEAGLQKVWTGSCNKGLVSGSNVVLHAR